MRINNSWFGFGKVGIILISMLLLVSCYQNTKGCLDNNAINFDPSVDKDCNGCCNYPSLKVQTRFFVDTIKTYRLGIDTLTFSNGKKLIIRKAGFWLGGFSFQFANNQNRLVLNDTLLIATNAGTLTSRADVFIFNGVNSLTFPNFSTNSPLSQVNFHFGLNDTTRLGNPLKVRRNSFLSQTTDSLYTDIANPYLYIGQNWNILVSDASGQNFTFKNVKIDLPSKLIYINKTLSKSTPRGNNQNLVLGVSLIKWLENVDWNSSNSNIQIALEKDFINAIFVQ
jgi:hypothetical protein